MPKKIRVLVAEGPAGTLAASLRAIYPASKGQLDLHLISSCSAILPTAVLSKPSIILLDLALAQPDPIANVRRVLRSLPGIPLVVVGDAAGHAPALQYLALGAAGALPAIFTNRDLERVLHTILRRFETAVVPGLPQGSFPKIFDRQEFLKLGAVSMESARNNGGTLILLGVWFTNLDQLVVEFGAVAAQQAAADVSALLSASFRCTDFTARVSQDEFVAVAVDAVEPSAPVLCQRVRSHAEIKNRARAPWGELNLRMNAGFWEARDSRTFAQFVGDVESGSACQSASPVAQPPAKKSRSGARRHAGAGS